MSDDDIPIYAVDQMYESDWFSEETMTKFDETNDSSKTWLQCQQFFEEAYIARKGYIMQNKTQRRSLTR